MRLIDADKLKEHYAWWGDEYSTDDSKKQKELFDVIVDLQPTADERKHGEWRPIQIGKWHGLECSVCKVSRDVPCGNNGIPQWKYCPECGAKMMEDNT